MEGWMVGWKDGWMEWLDGRMDGWKDGWMEGRMNGWMDGSVVGWISGRKVGCIGYWMLCILNYHLSIDWWQSQKIDWAFDWERVNEGKQRKEFDWMKNFRYYWFMLMVDCWNEGWMNNWWHTSASLELVDVGIQQQQLWWWWWWWW